MKISKYLSLQAKYCFIVMLLMSLLLARDLITFPIFFLTFIIVGSLFVVSIMGAWVFADDETYPYEERCWNCEEKQYFEIPMGTTIQDFKKKDVCEECGCKWEVLK